LSIGPDGRFHWAYFTANNCQPKAIPTHGSTVALLGVRPGNGRRRNRENLKAVRIEFVLLVEPHEEFRGADPQ